MPRFALAALLALTLAVPLRAQHGHAAHGAAPTTDGPAGLTADEVAGLRQGHGLGMARPAELNHYPGPLHVLELAGDLGLDAEQRATAERLRADMLAEAVPLGERIVQAEHHLDALFAYEEASPDAVGRMTAHIAELRGRLRAAHLRAHLGMRDALTPEQIVAYGRLRGHAE
ncbi:Spy/CpxP family protein refolding chaperone [Rubrivirga marina]|uniref:Periplasmic heavy metal sensor n=1 Tax=Rubrivirga marina TaxID=1196024 RepID=A0A271J5H2_9BACT|nr:Spy/CpxP family protein refolding chaperone [Rubrivirga marina]PAP78215.1 hypothetical protein BSZ37_18170 [Rubrivirga marina]